MLAKISTPSFLPPMTLPTDELEAARSDDDFRGKSEQQALDREIPTSESESLGSDKSVEEERLVCPVCEVFKAATLTAVNAHIDGCLAQTTTEERRRMEILSSPKPKSEPPKKKKKMRSVAEIFEVELEKKPDEVSITVTKFRWCSRRLESLRSGQSGGEICGNGIESANSSEKLEMVCPVCGDFNAETVTAVNAHIDGCLAKARMNFKQPKLKKTKKKRSISEILEVSPQIEAKKFSDELIDAIEEEEEEEKSDDSRFLLPSERNKNKNKKREKRGKRRWKKKPKKKRKVEKSSGGTTLNNNGLNANKEDAYKRKMKTPEKSSKKLKGTTAGKKRAALDGINASTHEKNESPKHASVEKKQEAMENSSTHTVQEQILSRHFVTFSNKDNMLIGPKKRSSSDERMFSSDEQVASSVKEKSSASDDESTCFEVNRKEVYSVVESKQFSTTPDEPVPPRKILRSCANSEKKKHLVEKFESVTEVESEDNDNLNLFDRGNTTSPHCYAQSSISGSLSAHQETRVGDSGAYSSPGKFMDHPGDSTHQVSAITDSDASTMIFMQTSSSYLTLYDQGNENPIFPSQTCGDNSQTLGYRSPLSHMFSANSSMDEENLFGLPLNSQGELINFISCAQAGMNKSETSSMLRSSSSRLLFDKEIAYRSSHEYLSIDESHFVQKTLSQDSVNIFPHHPARLSVTELQGSNGKADIDQFITYGVPNHLLYPLDSELKPMKCPLVEQNQHDQVQNQKRNEMIPLKKGSDLSSQSSTQQPTMRLMGKDVPIGRSIKEVQAQQFKEDELGSSFLGACSKQNHLSGSPLHTDHVPQNGIRGFSKTASCYYPHPIITHAHSSGSASNRGFHDSPEQSVSAPTFQGLGSHFAACNYSQNTCQSYGDLHDRKKPPLVEKPYFGEYTEASLFQSSQPRLLTQEKPPGTSSQQISGASNISVPHILWGGRFPTAVNHSLLNCSPLNYCHMKYTPISPLVKPSSSIPSGCRNKTVLNNRVILEDKTTNDHHFCNNTRKRPATNLPCGSTKQIKLNDIEVLENLKSSCEFGRATRDVEVAPPQGGSARNKSCCLNETQNIMSKSCYLGFEISGPGRLCPPTIPVAATSDTGRDLDFQRKLTKMYTF